MAVAVSMPAGTTVPTGTPPLPTSRFTPIPEAGRASAATTGVPLPLPFSLPCGSTTAFAGLECCERAFLNAGTGTPSAGRAMTAATTACGGAGAPVADTASDLRLRSF